MACDASDIGSLKSDVRLCEISSAYPHGRVKFRDMVAVDVAACMLGFGIVSAALS